MTKKNETGKKPFDPFLKYRFLVDIEGIDPYLVLRATRPKICLDGSGKTYQDFEVTLLDTAGELSCARMVLEWHDKWVRAGKLPFTIVIKQFRCGTEDAVATWTLEGATPSFLDFGDLDYECKEPCTVKIAFRYVAGALNTQ